MASGLLRLQSKCCYYANAFVAKLQFLFRFFVYKMIADDRYQNETLAIANNHFTIFLKSINICQTLLYFYRTAKRQLEASRSTPWRESQSAPHALVSMKKSRFVPYTPHMPKRTSPERNSITFNWLIESVMYRTMNDECLFPLPPQSLSLCSLCFIYFSGVSNQWLCSKKALSIVYICYVLIAMNN